LIPGLLCTGELWAPEIAGLSDLARITIADHGVADDMADIARAILAAAPARVLKLALLDTTAAPDSEDIRNARRFYIDLARSGRFEEITPNYLVKRLIHPDRLADGPLVEVILRMARETGVEVFIRQETAILNRPDGRPGLGAIACPTLVIVGDSDVVTPPERAREIAGAIANSCLEIIAGCGHLSTLEGPEAVTACLRQWLAA
jgi:pimeloyl-ACP methyl ester carboxylesterase